MDLAQSLDLLLPVIKYLLYHDFCFSVETLTRKEPKAQSKHLSEAFPCPPQDMCLLVMPANRVTSVLDSLAVTPPTSVLYLCSLSGEELARLGS